MWYVVEVNHCEPHQIEALTETLESFGAVSTTLTDEKDNPVLEPLPGETPLWPHIQLTALFSEEDLAKSAVNALKLSHPHLKICESTLEDQDWERTWMVHYEPMQFGQLWICPSWLTPPDPQAINLILDPGLAFGTGTHPTTALCLEWLGHANLQGLRAIDYGCGSGILALAACKLGAKHVTAVDIDEQAVIATEQNAKSNAITPSQLAIGLVDTLPLQAELLIANILLEPLLALKGQFREALSTQGTLVVSGLLTEQAQTLIEHYVNTFALHQQYDKDGWSLLEFKAF